MAPGKLVGRKQNWCSTRCMIRAGKSGPQGFSEGSSVMEQRAIRTNQSNWRALQCLLVILFLPGLCLPLTGCGVSQYFLGEADAPGESVAAAKSDSPKSTPARDRSPASPTRFEALGLESLENLLCERHPALVEIRQELAELRQESDSSWLPGTRWSDSDAGIESEQNPGDRQLALDWSPASLSREERQERQRSSRFRILSLQLEDTRNRLLLDLRQMWSDYWLQQQSVDLISDWLTRIEVAAESDESLESHGLLGELEDRVADWNQKIAQSSRLRISAVESINSLGSRPAGAPLAKPLEPGDVRFGGVEDLDPARRHPLEILAAERSRYSRTEIDYSDPRTWDGLVIGAHARQEHGQPVSGSGPGNKSGDWILTVGVEIPLGTDEVDRFRRQQMESAGSQRLELVRIRQQLQRRIESTRESVRTSQRKMDGYLQQKTTGIFDQLLAQLIQSDSAARFQENWQRLDSLLGDRLEFQQSVADCASGRFQLVELLAQPYPHPNGIQGLTRRAP